MNKTVFTFLLLSLALFSCTVSNKSASRNASANQQTIEAAPADQQDGSSFAKAIIIEENSTGAGISAEYAWVREHYPKSKVMKQSLHHQRKKSYDVLTVQKSNMSIVTVYFDITKFFGKF